ncbi:MAG: porin family protein [Pseudomonadota bacterium]
MRNKNVLKNLAVSCLLLSPLFANAQERSTADAGGTSWLPYTTHGYVGASAGKADFDVDCVATFSCDEKDTGFKVYTGGVIQNIFGLELSYVDLGSAERAGGKTHARGVDLSLIANAPLAEHFSIFGKVGTTYGWTKTEASAPGVQTGSERGFGVSYGAGLNFDFNRQWGARAEWERHRFQFVDNDRYVNLYTVGVNYKF